MLTATQRKRGRGRRQKMRKMSAITPPAAVSKQHNTISFRFALSTQSQRPQKASAGTEGRAEELGYGLGTHRSWGGSATARENRGAERAHKDVEDPCEACLLVEKQLLDRISWTRRPSKGRLWLGVLMTGFEGSDDVSKMRLATANGRKGGETRHLKCTAKTVQLQTTTSIQCNTIPYVACELVDSVGAASALANSRTTHSAAFLPILALEVPFSAIPRPAR